MSSKPIHICLVGPSGSGKTLYVRRLQGRGKEYEDYLENTQRQQALANYYGSTQSGTDNLSYPVSSTIGAHPETIVRIFNGREHSLQLWELGGFIPRDLLKKQELLEAHLKNTELVLVFCNLNDLAGLEKVAAQYIPDILKRYCENPNIRFALVGASIKRNHSPLINFENFMQFSEDQNFDDWFFITGDLQKESQCSFEQVLQSFIMNARKEALREKVDRYYQYRLVNEGFKTLAAWVAWLLGLSCLFGHSKKSDKVVAARALFSALAGNMNGFSQLTPSQQKALRNDRLGILYQEARSFVKEPSPSTVSIAPQKS